MTPVLFVLVSLLSATTAIEPTVFCGGKELLKCPTGDFCVDLPDDCHPELGDVLCPGVCYHSGYHTPHSQLTHTLPGKTSTEVFSCGGTDHRACPAGYHCVDLPDNCFPEHGDVNCDGACYAMQQPATTATRTADTKPVATHVIAHCGGPQALVCPNNYVCVDLPDTCNPLTGDLNCPGICYLSAVRTESSGSTPLVTSSAAGIALPAPQTLGGKIALCGINHLECESGYTCVDLPDDCDPLKGGTNCPGLCYLHTDASSGAGTAVTLDHSQYTVSGSADLSALKEYKKEAETYCHTRDTWTHTKALWCCQHEQIGCPHPGYAVAHNDGSPLGVSDVPKACLYNQCPASTTTCVADPHICTDKTQMCFQYKCEPIESNPLHKATTAGCSLYKNCQTCTKKYNWQGEQCAWCMSTGTCRPQSTTLNSCQAGARLYANECPVATSTGMFNPGSGSKTSSTTTPKNAASAKTASHGTGTSKAATTSASEKAGTPKSAATTTTETPKSAVSKTYLKTEGPQGPKGPPGPPGPIIESPNVKAAVSACSGKTTGKDACSFKLTSGKVVSGICWHNKNAKDPSYCSAKFKARVSNWINSYSACKPSLAGTTCNYKTETGTNVLGACVPHNFLGAPANFNVFLERHMGRSTQKAFSDLQRDLFFDEEDEDHERTDDDDFDEDSEDDSEKDADDMASFLDTIDLRSMRKLLSHADQKKVSSLKKPARLFCASHTSHDVSLWNAAVRACSNKKVSALCGYSMSPNENKIGRCVNGNVGSYAKDAKKVKKLYCRPNASNQHG